jgi:hypothetical protein
MKIMNFTDTQLQACFELYLAEARGVSDELQEVSALLATHDWFRMLEGSHSSRVQETIEHLLSPALRPGLHRWYRRPGANLGAAATEFRDQLSHLAGERLEKAEPLALRPRSARENSQRSAEESEIVCDAPKESKPGNQ